MTHLKKKSRQQVFTYDFPEFKNKEIIVLVKLGLAHLSSEHRE